MIDAGTICYWQHGAFLVKNILLLVLQIFTVTALYMYLHCYSTENIVESIVTVSKVDVCIQSVTIL